MLFILVTMGAFIPDNDETPAFAGMMDDIAANSPGVSLLVGRCMIAYSRRLNRLSSLETMLMSMSMSQH